MRCMSWIVTLLLCGCAACPRPCCPPQAEGAPDVAPAEAQEEPAEPAEVNEALALLTEADGVFRSRKYEASRPIYIRALAQARATADRRVQVEALAQIARTYSITKKGIEAAEAMKDDSWLAVLWNNLGATYEDLKRYDEALAAYEKARVYHHRGERELPKMIADWAVGHAHRLAGHTQAARTGLEKTLAWAERLYAKDPKLAAEWLGYIQEDLGHVAVAEKDAVGALELFIAAHKRFVEGGLDKHWPEHVQKLETLIRELKAD